jgi:hypothetical protein
MWAEVRTNWPPLREQVRGRWNRLTDQDIVEIGGQRPQLIAFLRLRYGLDKREATTEADSFVRALQVLSL